MKKKCVWMTVFICFIYLVANGYALPASEREKIDNSNILGRISDINVPFIENRGQIKNGDIRFYAHINDGALFVGNNGEITYHLALGEHKRFLFTERISEKPNRPSGLSIAPTRISIFKGKDPASWRAGIPSCETIDLGEVYKNITLALRAYHRNVEKIFTVLPGGKPENISINVAGTSGLVVNDKNELEVRSDGGSVRFTPPIAYQMKDGVKQFVDVSYTVKDRLHYGFKVGKYDRKTSLIIDPLLASTLIGGSTNDFSWGIALDGNGNVFVSSNTTSYLDFPTTPGAYDVTYNGGVSDIYVAKFDSTLNNLLACTFLGGADADTSYRIALDESGNVFVTGFTLSADFPVTSGAYVTPSRGGKDAYVAYFDNDLSTLVSCTLIGGGGDDAGYDILIDGSENIIITGYTKSSDYPTTTGAYDQVFNGVQDVMLSKFDKLLTTLLASTFLGGDGDDTGTGITFDGNGHIVMTGAAGDNFPTTPGAWNRTYTGGGEAFVARMDNSLSTLMASTYIGGSANEYGYTVKVNKVGEIYMAGELWSDDYPVTPQSYDPTWNGGVMDVMISKFDSSLSTLLASTYLGGNAMDWHHHNLLLDDQGNVYINGLTKSADFPLTPNADIKSKSSDFTVFITKLDSNLSAILYSTYFGGVTVGNGSLDMVFDPDYNVYITGWTTCTDFPTTSGAYDRSYNGAMDVFVSKLCIPGNTHDGDCDGVGNDADNCDTLANPGQEDNYPPGGNGCGDACECEGNFDGDRDQDSLDAAAFKKDLGRSSYKNPCSNEKPCKGDFTCDLDVDSLDAAKFKSDLGRSSLSNPCPSCFTNPWCIY